MVPALQEDIVGLGHGRFCIRELRRSPGVRLTASAATICRMTLSCSANTSPTEPSYRSAQTWWPLSASISWALIRTWSPLRRTLPSST